MVFVKKTLYFPYVFQIVHVKADRVIICEESHNNTTVVGNA